MKDRCVELYKWIDGLRQGWRTFIVWQKIFDFETRRLSKQDAKRDEFKAQLPVAIIHTCLIVRKLHLSDEGYVTTSMDF